MLLRIWHYLVRRLICNRKGHLWGGWIEHSHANATIHFRHCKRCEYSECKEGLGGLVAFTASDPKRISKLKAAFSDTNPILLALQKRGAIQKLDGGREIDLDL